MFGSSEDIMGSSMEDAFLRLLTYNKNRSGPKVKPCRTPHFTRQYSVLQFSST